MEQSARSMRVSFRFFRGTWVSWEELFEQAASFATEVGPERLIGISHSSDTGDSSPAHGVITVWYWSDGQPQEDAGA